MDNGSKGAAKTTAGLDLGDNYSHLCLLDTQSGEVIEEGRVRTTPEAIRRRFDSEQPLRIAIEVGTHSPWVSRLLEECGHKVLVANARKLHLIYGNKRKTDKLDAENLARLARVDPKLLYPLEHRSEQSQAHLALLHSREALVRARTQLINHVRGTVKSFRDRLPKCSTQSFHKKVVDGIPEVLRAALEPILETIASLSARIRELRPQTRSARPGALPGDEPLKAGTGSGNTECLGLRADPGGPGSVRAEPDGRRVCGTRAGQGPVGR